MQSPTVEDSLYLYYGLYSTKEKSLFYLDYYILIFHLKKWFILNPLFTLSWTLAWLEEDKNQILSCAESTSDGRMSSLSWENDQSPP